MIGLDISQAFRNFAYKSITPAVDLFSYMLKDG